MLRGREASSIFGGINQTRDMQQDSRRGFLHPKPSALLNLALTQPAREPKDT
jgi:hypothetical protein